jgi:DNA-binding response OmpR family regulator
MDYYQSLEGAMKKTMNRKQQQKFLRSLDKYDSRYDIHADDVVRQRLRKKLEQKQQQKK